MESRDRMELRGTLLPLLLHQYAFPAHLRLGRRCGEKTGASATSLGSYLLPEGWKRRERMWLCAYETERVKQPWKQNSGPRVYQASALLLSHSSDIWIWFIDELPEEDDMTTLVRKWRGSGSGQGSYTCLVFTMPWQLGGVWNRYPCLFTLVNATSALLVGKQGSLRECDCVWLFACFYPARCSGGERPGRQEFTPSRKFPVSPRVLLFDGTSLFCLESDLYLKKRSTHSLTEHRGGGVTSCVVWGARSAGNASFVRTLILKQFVFT